MRNDKIVMAGVAALLVGALIGWGASHWTGNAGAQSDSLGTNGLIAQEPEGSITPTQPYESQRPRQQAPSYSGTG